MEYEGEKFLCKLYNGLYKKDIVIKSSLSKDCKYLKIRKYLNRLEEINNIASKRKRKSLLYDLYYNKYINKDAKEEDKIDEQATLKIWLDYLLEDNNKYPIWIKYWIFQSIIKIGTYDEASSTYKKRTPHTIAPFIELNKKVLDECIEEILVDKNNSNFNKLYIKKLNINKKNLMKKDPNDGIWIKYDMDSEEDALYLYYSLQGKNTGWCTANSIVRAKNQICGGYGYNGGDFYVYYTKDEENKYTMPRIAIRMTGKKEIKEIRGILESQNLEEELEEIVVTFLDYLDIKNKDEYFKKIKNSKELTRLVKKVYAKEELTIKEYYFINEIFNSATTFCWGKDPRLKRIKEKSLIKDEDILFNLIEAGLNNFDNVHPSLINNPLIAKRILDYDNKLFSNLKVLSSDKEIIRRLIKKDILYYDYIDPNLKKDIIFISELININMDVYYLLSDDMKRNPVMIASFIKKFENINSIYEFVLRYIVDKKMQDSYIHTLIAGYIDVRLLTYANKRFFKSETFVSRFNSEEKNLYKTNTTLKR